jgi:hypothetical protein
MSSIGNHLIPDLSNVVGSYTDNKTYQTLMENDPKTFTKQKLVKNITEEIPMDELILFSKAYNYAKQWIESRKEMNEKMSETSDYETIKPIQLVNIFIKYIKMFGDFNDVTDIDELSNMMYSQKEQRIYKEACVEENIEHEAFSIEADIIESIDVDKFMSKYITKDFRDKYEKLLNRKYQLPEEYDMDYEFKLNLRNSISVLMNTDPNFHPLRNIDNYGNKLLEFILINLEEEVLKEEKIQKEIQEKELKKKEKFLLEYDEHIDVKGFFINSSPKFIEEFIQFNNGKLDMKELEYNIFVEFKKHLQLAIIKLMELDFSFDPFINLQEKKEQLLEIILNEIRIEERPKKEKKLVKKSMTL